MANTAFSILNFELHFYERKNRHSMASSFIFDRSNKTQIISFIIWFLFKTQGITVFLFKRKIKLREYILFVNFKIKLTETQKNKNHCGHVKYNV